MKIPMALGLVLLIASAAAPVLADVTELIPVKYGAFGQSVAFIEAQARGYFEEFGLQVTYTQVAGSAPQFAGLYDGTYDIISTTTDNSINRYVNRGDIYMNMTAPPVQIVSAASQGPKLALWSNKTVIPTIADVKNKTIAVDAPGSGLVYTLRKLLADKAGLFYPADYSFSPPAGGTGQRLAKLLNGTAIASMLYSPYLPPADNATYSSGLTNLGLISSVIPSLQLDGLTTLRSYPTQEPGATIVPRFLAALIKGGRYARKASKRDTVIANIAEVYPTAPADYLDAILDPSTGENIDLAMNFDGLKAAIDLRKQFGGFGPRGPTVNSTTLVQPAPEGLYYDAYLNQALQLVKKAKKHPKKYHHKHHGRHMLA